MTGSGYGAGLEPDSGQFLTQSHNFTGYSSGTMAEIAARVVSEFAHEKDEYYDDVVLYRNDVGLEETILGCENEEEQEADRESDFEFEFAVPGGEEKSSPISADEIFHNGQIKPMFPIFNTDLVYGNAGWRSNFHFDGDNRSVSHPPPTVTELASNTEKSTNSSEISAIRLPFKKLLLSERETSLTASASCSSSDADDLEGANPETYCVWTPPKQEMSKKSNSTGSSKRWKLRNLVHRSHSDGREKFVFLTPKQEEEQQSGRSSASEKPAVPSSKVLERSGSGGGRRKGEKTPSPATAAVGKAHQEHYLRNRATRESDRKKSYLPYKQDLVGFFAGVNGLSRTMQPF